MYVLFNNNDLDDITYVNGQRASTTFIVGNVQDFKFTSSGALAEDFIPGVLEQLKDLLVALGKDILSIVIEAVAYYYGGGPILGFETAKLVGDAVSQSSIGQEIWTNENNYWHSVEAGGVIAVSTAVTIVTAGAASEVTAPVIAGAIGATAGAAVGAAVNTAYDYATTGQLSYDWKSVAEAPLLSLVGAGIGADVGSALEPTGQALSQGEQILSGAASAAASSAAGAGLNAWINHTPFDLASAIGSTIEGAGFAALQSHSTASAAAGGLSTQYSPAAAAANAYDSSVGNIQSDRGGPPLFRPQWKGLPYQRKTIIS